MAAMVVKEENSTFMRNFVKSGMLEAAKTGGLPVHTIIEKSMQYHEKGILTEEDLKEIAGAVNLRNGAEVVSIV